jgi:hypothetical protein
MMTNILKIALQKGEERLACIITAYYNISVKEDMIGRALINGNFDWLMFLFAFGKNKVASHHVDYASLFGLILKLDGASNMEMVCKVLDWKIVIKDNILKGLLAHHLDKIAIDFMGQYSRDLTSQLFSFCTANGNSEFLKQALKLGAFDSQTFRNEKLIKDMLKVLHEGSRTLFLMDVLALIDLSVWKNKQLKELIDIINDYSEDVYYKNKLLLCANPL